MTIAVPANMTAWALNEGVPVRAFMCAAPGVGLSSASCPPRGTLGGAAADCTEGACTAGGFPQLRARALAPARHRTGTQARAVEFARHAGLRRARGAAHTCRLRERGSGLAPARRSARGACMPKSRGEPRVVVSKNGPYLVSGGVPLAAQTIVADQAGESHAWKQGAAVPASESYALCRCGRSANKPF